MTKVTDETTTATTTDEGAEGAADKSTEAAGKPTSEEQAASSAASDNGDDQSGSDEGSDGAAGDEGAGDSASQDDADKSQSDKAKQNREAAKLRIAQKNKDTADLRQKLQEDYVDQAADDNDRRIREMETDRYIENIERVGRDIARDNEQAAREISLFNPASPDFNKDLLDRSLKRYARDCLTQDSNGQIVKYSIPLLDYLREEAGMYGAAYSGKQIDQQQAAAAKKAKADKAKAQMDAAAEGAQGASAQAAEAKKTGTDTFDDAFLAGFDNPDARHKPRDAHTFSAA